MRRMACEPPTVNAVPPDRDRTAEAPAPGVSPAAERRNWPQQNIFRSGKMSKFGHGALCVAENGAEGTGAARARRPFSERRTHVSEFRPCHISGRGGTPSNNSPEGGGEWGTRQEITLRASDLSAAKSSASCSGVCTPPSAGSVAAAGVSACCSFFVRPPALVAATRSLDSGAAAAAALFPPDGGVAAPGCAGESAAAVSDCASDDMLLLPTSLQNIFSKNGRMPNLFDVLKVVENTEKLIVLLFTLSFLVFCTLELVQRKF